MFELIRTDNPELASLEKLNAAILTMQESLDGKVYDLGTPKGLKLANADRSALRKIRTGTEKTRKELKKPHLDASKLIDNIAKQITAAVVEVETPLTDLIKADAERKAKEKAEAEERERQRVNKIQNVIHQLRDSANRCHSMTAVQITESMDKLKEYPIGDGFAEFQEQATKAVELALDDMAALYIRVYDQEQADAARAAEDERLKVERAELDKMKAELAEQKPEQTTQNVAKMDIEDKEEVVAEVEKIIARKPVAVASVIPEPDHLKAILAICQADDIGPIEKLDRIESYIVSVKDGDCDE